MRTTRLALTLLIAGVLWVTACTSGPKTSTGRTEREADSVIGQSQLPGAQGVQKAMEAQDTARGQAAALDGVGQ